MEPDEFRKLHVHLPRQPVVNQRPWWIAGLLLAFIILLIAAWSYYAHKKRLASPEQQVKMKGWRGFKPCHPCDYAIAC